MSMFARQHAEWQDAKAVADTTGTPATIAAAEQARQALIASRAVQAARSKTNARPVS